LERWFAALALACLILVSVAAPEGAATAANAPAPPPTATPSPTAPPCSLSWPSPGIPTINAADPNSELQLSLTCGGTNPMWLQLDGGQGVNFPWQTQQLTCGFLTQGTDPLLLSCAPASSPSYLEPLGEVLTNGNHAFTLSSGQKGYTNATFGVIGIPTPSPTPTPSPAPTSAPTPCYGQLKIDESPTNIGSKTAPSTLALSMYPAYPSQSHAGCRISVEFAFYNTATKATTAAGTQVVSTGADGRAKMQLYVTLGFRRFTTVARELVAHTTVGTSPADFTAYTNSQPEIKMTISVPGGTKVTTKPITADWGNTHSRDLRGHFDSGQLHGCVKRYW